MLVMICIVQFKQTIDELLIMIKIIHQLKWNKIEDL